MGHRKQRKGNGRRAAIKKISLTNTCSHSTTTTNYNNSMNLQSEKIRRRQTTTSKSSPTSSCPAILVPSTPLPLAVYQPNRLFAMLLVSLLLPKNTFSLRWLALSGGGGMMTISGRGIIKNSMTNGMNNERRRIPPSYSLAMALDPELAEASPTQEEVSSDDNKQYITTLWKDVTSELEKVIVIDSSNIVEDEEDDIGDWSIDSILNTIPRGGGRRNNNNNNSNEDEEKIYAGLINLGNTCYLNSQLQCAYHVPYLRQLIKSAKDEIVEVEVEVEVEIDDDEDENVELAVEESDQMLESEGDVEALEESVCEDTTEKDAVNTDSVESNDVETSEAPVDDEAEKPETNPQEETLPTLKKKTIIQKETKEEVVSISYALQALKVIFNSLTQSKGGTASTSVLCRTLGINPYLQQDGQEFWKLFVPELNNDELTSLYSGYFEDYVREIKPEEEEDDGEEKKDDDDEPQAVASEEGTARERIRTEPFLDLSIPVAEGTGGSVESTLQEMFTEPEILRVSEGNGWRPSKGADKVDAYKGSSLKRDGLPSLLQLHLKRFKYDWETEETSKINDCCSFPVELDLSEIIAESDDGNNEDDEIYDLQSIVIHKGEYGSGHYYSYVRPDIRSDDWYRFDDEFVTKVDYSDVVADAYGGSRKTRRKRSRSNSLDNNVDDNIMPVATKRRRRWGPIRLILGIFRRVAMIGSNSAGRGGDGGGFGYGGRSSNAYMLQYVRRSDIPKLYLEE